MKQYASFYANQMVGDSGRLTLGLPRLVISASVELLRLHDLAMECRRCGIIHLAFIDTDVDDTRFNY